MMVGATLSKLQFPMFKMDLRRMSKSAIDWGVNKSSRAMTQLLEKETKYYLKLVLLNIKMKKNKVKVVFLSKNNLTYVIL
jgi:hypothetical protein